MAETEYSIQVEHVSGKTGRSGRTGRTQRLRQKYHAETADKNSLSR